MIHSSLLPFFQVVEMSTNFTNLTLINPKCFTFQSKKPLNLLGDKVSFEMQSDDEWGPHLSWDSNQNEEEPIFGLKHFIQFLTNWHEIKTFLNKP